MEMILQTGRDLSPASASLARRSRSFAVAVRTCCAVRVGQSMAACMLHSMLKNKRDFSISPARYKPSRHNTVFPGRCAIIRSQIMNSDLSAVFSAMSVRQLKKELSEKGIDASSCIEKSELVHLLVTNRDVEARQRQQPQPAAVVAASSAAGNTSEPHGKHRLCMACGKEQGCQQCHGMEGKMLRCNQCKAAYYCSKACQVADWPTHKVRCKLLQEDKQRFADSVGTEMATAYAAWLKRIDSLIADALTVALFPAPHFLPRNRTHGLMLHVTSTSNSKPPRFKIELCDEFTLEEICAFLTRPDAEPPQPESLWPAGPPDADIHAETMRAVIFSTFGKTKMVRSVQHSMTGGLVASIKAGRFKLPSVKEIIAKINMLA